MKILITGASGFCGRNLLPRLRAEEGEVYSLVRTSSGAKNEILWNFTDPVPTGIPECDVVIHLAASVDFGKDFCPQTYLINVGATSQLVAYARKSGSHFIFASMTGIHGGAERLGKDTPIDLQNNYAASKYLAESVVSAQLDSYSILRMGGIYGLDGPIHLGLNTAISNAFHRGESPVLRGSGKAKRNYICINDVVTWIKTLVSQGRKKRKEILYLGGPEELSVRDYLERVAKHLLKDASEVELKDGGDGTDSIVEGTQPPFRLTPFAEYLDGLLSKKNTGKV